MMVEKLLAWVEQARRLPLAFAQVREDPWIDLEAVRIAGSRASVLMIASGGCTAALLAVQGNVSQLHLVDANPAQLALAKLKLGLLTSEPARRRALLGHAPMSAKERYEAIAKELAEIDLPSDAFGPPEVWAEEGPDHAGRYERCFAALRRRLQPQRSEIESLLKLSDPAKQIELVEPTTPLGRAIDAALEETMSLPNLVGLFGEQATQNPRQDFSRHFAERTRHVLGTMDAASNPWLWQMYLGRFTESVAYPWLDAAGHAALPEVVDGMPVSAPLRAFNSVLTTACVLDEWEVGVGCMGIIEFAFADISAQIGKAVVDRGWVRSEDLVHYKLHAEIDSRHAEEFFAVVEPLWDDDRRRYFIEQGLDLGAYVFDRLYRDLRSLGGL